MLTVVSGGLFHDGCRMGHWELMVALDVSCLLSHSFTVGFWGFALWGVPDGPLRVDGGSWCELPPLTLIYCWVLGVCFMRGTRWATESWWWLLMWAASSHSHLLLGSGGLFYEGHRMGHYELMAALDVSYLLSPSFTSGFWGFVSWGVPTCH